MCSCSLSGVRGIDPSVSICVGSLFSCRDFGIFSFTFRDGLFVDRSVILGDGKSILAVLVSRQHTHTCTHVFCLCFVWYAW